MFSGYCEPCPTLGVYGKYSPREKWTVKLFSLSETVFVSWPRLFSLPLYTPFTYNPIFEMRLYISSRNLRGASVYFLPARTCFSARISLAPTLEIFSLNTHATTNVKFKMKMR